MTHWTDRPAPLPVALAILAFVGYMVGTIPTQPAPQPCPTATKGTATP
jgi:hypothetical protein